MHLLTFSLLGILALPIVIGHDTDLCPPPESILPCECLKACSGCMEVIQCSNIKNVNELLDVFSRSGDFPFDHTRLINSSLLYCPTSFLDTKKTRILTITDTTLASIFDAPPPRSNRLSSITLTRVKVQQGMNWELFSTLYNPYTLSLIEMDVRKIGNNFGSQISTNIRNVEFTKTKTLELGSTAFAPLINIDYIIVKNNKVKILKRSMFPTPYIGTRLEFSNNEIETLSSDLFTEMPFLSVLDLNGNQLTSLTQSEFGNLPSNLHTILVEENPIVCDCQMRWIVGKKMPHIAGECTGNHVNAGKLIQRLQASDFNYCQ